MSFNPEQDKLLWETLEIPLTNGVDLNTPEKGVRLPKLLKLENGCFDSAGTVRKRPGHSSVTIRNQKTGTSTPASPGEWDTANGGHFTHPSTAVYRYGLGTYDAAHGFNYGNAAFCTGVARRENESVFTNGYRLFSLGADRADDEANTPSIYAPMPTAKSWPLKRQSGVSHRNIDIAVGPEISAVMYDVGDNIPKVTVWDTKTGAVYVEASTQVGGGAAHVAWRCIATENGYIHFYVGSGTLNTIRQYTLHRDTPTSFSGATTIITTTTGEFAVRRDTDATDSHHIVIAAHSTTGAQMVHLEEAGTVFVASTALDCTPTDGNEIIHRLSFDVHPISDEIALIWAVSSNAQVHCRVFTRLGVAVNTRFQVESAGGWDTGGITRADIAAEYQVDGSSRSLFRAFWSGYDTTPLPDEVYAKTCLVTSAGVSGATSTKHWMCLPGEGGPFAFCVGGSAFCAMVSNQGVGLTGGFLQSTYYIVDQNLDPVAHLSQGTSMLATSAAGAPNQSQHAAIRPSNIYSFDQLVFDTAILVDENAGTLANPAFYVKQVQLDFLPRVRSAERNGITYFAGGQVSQYDGLNWYESGFHQYPESATPAVTAGGGFWAATGTYQYKARWVYDAANGERIVSATATYSAVVVNVTDTVTLEIRTNPVTVKEGAYLMIYRLDPGQSQYREVVYPGQLVNDPTVAVLTFADTGSFNNAFDSLGDAGELEPFSPPSCEVITYGRERLWLSGGEIDYGTVVPSKPDKFGYNPEFNEFLSTIISQDTKDLTGIAFMGTSVLLFRDDTIFAIESDGPNALGIGSFDVPRQIVFGTGCIEPNSIVQTQGGVFFQSKDGIRQLMTNYLVSKVGEPVDELAQTVHISRGILVPERQEVRFYTYANNVLVYDLMQAQWATWSGPECAGAIIDAENQVRLGRINGECWIEDDTLGTDQGSEFVFSLKLAAFHSNITQGLVRVRRVSLSGYSISGNDDIIACKAYYDDNPIAVESWSFVPDGVGAGVPFTFRHRMARQKCSRLILEFTEASLATTLAYGLTHVALEVGRRGGLGRLTNP